MAETKKTNSSQTSKSTTKSNATASKQPAKSTTTIKSTTTKSTKKRSRSVWGLNKISFYLLGAVAILYLVGLILSAINASKLGTAVNILQSLATAMMICVVAFLGWKYVRPKQTVWQVLFFVLLLIIIIGIIVPMVL